MSKSKKAHPPSKSSHAPAVPQGGHGGEHHDELLHVPKGESRLRFYLILALTIFVLLIFVVPSAFLGTMGGGDQTDEVLMTWTSPSGVDKSLRSTEFYQSMREFDRLRNWAQYFGMEGLEKAGEPEAARFLLLEDLAKEWGLVITDREVGRTVLAMFQGDAVAYDGWIRSQRGLSKALFESIVRRAIGIRRVQDLLRAGLATADPAKVEESWRANHQEYAFDTVTVETQGYREAARAELPTDDALRAWFETRSEAERMRFRSPERWSLEVAWAPVEGEASYPALIEAYPPSADVDPDVRANSYYNSVSYIRFRRPLPEEDASTEGADGDGAAATDEAGSDGGDDLWQDGTPAGEVTPPEEGAQDAAVDGASDEGGNAAASDGADADAAGQETPGAEVPELLAAPPQNPLYFSFDEVADACRREAPIHAAFQEWMADLRQRAQNGEEIDLETEAARLGLAYDRSEAPQSREEWLADEVHGWAGAQLASMSQRTQVGELVPTTLVSEGGFSVARVLERRAPEVPPFEDVRDDVADAWVQGHAVELAVAALEEVRDLLGERPVEPDAEFAPIVSAEVFTEAASKQGFEVKRRDYRERLAPTPDEPDVDVVTEGYLRGSTSFYTALSDGEVPPAEANRTGTHAFLVRLEGARDADLSKARPSDLASLRNTAASTAADDTWNETFGSFEFLERRFGLWLRRTEQETGDEDAPGS